MDYKLYKFQKAIKKAFKKLIKIVFYFPAWLYKNNESFYKLIKESESKSYAKSRKKYLAERVFRCLERQKECTILAGTDFDNKIGFDLDDYGFDLLFSDEKWIKRNKLRVDRMILDEYVKTYLPDKIWALRDWNKDKKVFIVSR